MVKQPAHRPVATRGQRRRRLTRRSIAQAVVDVGFGGATLTAVAEHLGVNHASLYGHVAHRDEMLRAAAELVMDGVDWPPLDGRWEDVLRREARVMWALFRQHPGLSSVLGTAPSPPTSMVERYGALATFLYRSGFDAHGATAAAELTHHLVADAAERESLLADVDEEQIERWDREWSSALPTELERAMVERADRQPDDRLDELLAVLVAGVGARFSGGQPEL